MIEPAFGTLLVAAVGAVPLAKPGLRAACDTAIPLSAIAARAQEEDSAAFSAHAEP
jgi:hypothetical protein